MLKPLLIALAAWASIGGASAATTVTWSFSSGASDITTPGSQINRSPYGNTTSNVNTSVPIAGGPGNSATNTSGAWGNTIQTLNGGINATAQAWSNTGGTTSTSNSTNYSLESAYLGLYSGGVGVNNRDGIGSGANSGDSGDVFSTAPEHAVDNQQRYDSVLFSFSTAVTLQSMSLGYPDSGCSINGTTCDTDMTVLAWTGTGTPTLTGTSYNAMDNAGSGWQLVGQYSNNPSNNTPFAINGGNASSQYWLIGTCIPVFGTSCDTKADVAKISTVAGFQTPPPGVPEPGSLGLAGITIGALGLVRRLRRRGQSR